MKNNIRIIKYLIIALTILAMLVICVLITYKNKFKEKTGEYNSIDTTEDLKKELSTDEYFTIWSCIGIYLESINTENSSFYGVDNDGKYSKIIDDNEIKTIIYNLLSSEYIEDNEITISNIYNKITTFKENLLFAPLEIEKIYNNKVNTYYVHGIAESANDYHMIQELHLIVNVDDENESFSIEILNDKPQINSVKEKNYVKQNDNNIKEKIDISNKDIIENYVTLYKRIILAMPEWFYDNILDESYKKQCFDSLEDFKEYIELNKSNIIGIKASSYKIEDKDNYKQYIIIDKSGNYYYFKENEILNYTVVPNNYVVLVSEELDKYNNASDQQKVSINIQRFIKAINEKNYRFAYNCLSNGFKKNYFSTLESFEEYINKNIFSQSTVELLEYSVENKVHQYKILIIVDGEDGESKTIEKTIIMKLNEETDFEMSFNVN